MTKLNKKMMVKKPRTALLIDKLRSEIVNGKWGIGQKIPAEPELSLLYQVGRNTVREAIKALSYSGLLEVRQGSGTYVKSNIDVGALAHKMTEGGLVEHFEMRCLIESEAARLAAKRRTHLDILKLKQCLDERGDFCGSSLTEESLNRDIQFHLAIAEASGNRSLLLLYNFFSASVKNYTKNALTLVDICEPDLKAHQRVLDAIIAQNANDAEEAVHAMINPLISQLGSWQKKNNIK